MMFSSHFDLCDVVSVLIQCEDDTFFIVQEPSTQEFWIPSAKIYGGKTWRATAKSILETVRVTANLREICYNVKVWKPPENKNIFHVVFSVHVAKEAKEFSVAPPTKKAFWATISEVQMSYPRLRSLELLDFLSAVLDTEVQRPKQPLPKQTFSEHTSWTSLIEGQSVSGLTEIREAHVIPSYELMHRKIMDISGFTLSVQHSIYALFLLSCFPCTYMNVRIFTTIAERLGWEKTIGTRLFATADLDNRGFLSCRDFLHIVAVTDPNAQHGYDCDIRSSYIFRYYDLNNDHLLDYNETKSLFNDMRQAKNKTQDSMALCRDFDAFSKLLGFEAKKCVNVEAFKNALSSPILRGTTVLLRLSRSITTLAPNLTDIAPRATAVTRYSNVQSQSTSSNQFYTKRPDYSVAAHCVKLKKLGTTIDQIWNMPQAMSESSLNLGKANLMNSPSLDAFNPSKVHFEVLRGLEYFEREIIPKDKKRKSKSAFHWGQVDPSGFAKCLVKISEMAASLLAREPRLLEVSSPVYVMGDLHGNFIDLLRFEKALWPLGPSLSPATLLALGDYVDRGAHSIELLAYLFAYKVQCPYKVLMVRGNHETRQVQKLFTFYTECIFKFGERLGLEVWEAINRAMDCMPLAAVVDGKVFCVHGGIPPPWLCPTMKAILNVPCPLPRPEEQSSLAWELMWNDPIDSNASPALLREIQQSEGFASNEFRQTGHVFSTEALMRFLKVNNLNLVIRAHQTKEKGFYVQMRNCLETVFSSPNFTMVKNEGACILVDQGRLRPFLITPGVPK